MCNVRVFLCNSRIYFRVIIEGKKKHTPSQPLPGSHESEPGYNQLHLSLCWPPLTPNTSRGHSLCPEWAILTLWEGNNRNSLLMKPSVCLSQGRGGVLLYTLVTVVGLQHLFLQPLSLTNCCSTHRTRTERLIQWQKRVFFDFFHKKWASFYFTFLC